MTTERKTYQANWAQENQKSLSCVVLLETFNGLPVGTVLRRDATTGFYFPVNAPVKPFPVPRSLLKYKTVKMGLTKYNEFTASCLALSLSV